MVSHLVSHICHFGIYPGNKILPALLFRRCSLPDLWQAQTCTCEGVLFGFVSSGLIGGMFWILPRMVNTPIFSPRLAKLTAVLWNGAIISGILLILSGNTQGREYAELPWSIDVLVMIVLLLIHLNIFLTLANRTEKKLYVSTWYYLGTFL
jgi:cytochrome c oxidase cbb3-type subunit I/II